MANKQQKLKKKKAREKRAKKKVLQRREITRDTARLEKEADRMAWENRERLPPIRNPNKIG
jgi:hypothetical protein